MNTRLDGFCNTRLPKASARGEASGLTMPVSRCDCAQRQYAALQTRCFTPKSDYISGTDLHIEAIPNSLV